MGGPKSDIHFEADRAHSVSYGSHRNQAPKSANFTIPNSLFTISVSPLSHLPSYSGGHSLGYPEGSSGDCPAGHPERNLESYLDSYPVSYSEGYPGRNSENGLRSCRDGSSAGCSADCPPNPPASSPERNPASNSESCPENSWENCWADCLPGDFLA